MNNIEQTIKNIYTTYPFSKDGYKKNEEVLYNLLDRAFINKTINFNAFKILKADFSKCACSLKFIDGEISTTSIQISRCNTYFINVLFDDCKFINSGLDNTIFINCKFVDCVFTKTAIRETVFLNCEFSNTAYTQDTTIEQTYFINTNPDDLFIHTNDGKIKSDILFVSSNQSIQDSTVFGLFDIQDTTQYTEPTCEMDGNYHGINITETLPDEKKNYIECRLTNITIPSQKFDDNLFSKCILENCNFINVEFTDVTFDGSTFKNCSFDNCNMFRCSLINTHIDDKTKLGVRFDKCNTYNMKIEGTTDTAFFKDTYNPKELENLKAKADAKEQEKSNQKEVGRVANQEDLINQLNLILEAVQSEEYIDSLQKKQETHEEDVLEFFNSKDLQETSFLVTTILNNQNIKTQNQKEPDPSQESSQPLNQQKDTEF